ncbi:MAG TPA: hypothetical protein VFK70_11610 [Vicinamibacteria bacterium]|nr:hypothetical protein [Vicinamibacteria bacterium]
MIVFLVVAGAGVARAWEPPFPELKRGVSQASVLFSGRVLSLREIDVHPERTIAEARVKVLECHLAAACQPGQTVRVRFLSRSLQEEVDEVFGMETTLTVSTTVLFAITAPVRMTSPMLLNVDVHRHGIDNGWVLEEDPRAEGHWAADGEGVVSSLYWSRDRQTIKRAELRSWIEARRAELASVKRD